MGKKNKLFIAKMRVELEDEEYLKQQRRSKTTRAKKDKTKKVERQKTTKIESVFARKDAQLAEQQRRDRYLEVVYKKIQEEQEDDFLR